MSRQLAREMRRRVHAAGGAVGAIRIGPRPLATLPAGTVGAVNMSTCEAACFKGPPSATYRCTRCAHVYDAERDGNGVPFEDLPEDWKCPTCGAPKSAYAKEEESDGTVRWAHAEERD